ncbi:MAG: peptide deformylase [Patescibacteria group bacterium]
MILEVVKYPSPILTQKSQKALFNKELKALVQNMLDTINSFKKPQAAGLSAIQVDTPLRVLIARDIVSNQVGNDGSHEMFNDFILVNPKFVSFSKEEELDWEGCLSFPDLYGKVWRSKKVKLKYQNIQGREQRLTASNFLARVIQHEMDHLDGITFNTKIVGKMHKGEELEKGVTI